MRNIHARSSILGILEVCGKAAHTFESQSGCTTVRIDTHVLLGIPDPGQGQCDCGQAAYTAAKGRPVQLRKSAGSDTSQMPLSGGKKLKIRWDFLCTHRGAPDLPILGTQSLVVV